VYRHLFYKTGLIALLLTLTSVATLAEELTDPTRPADNIDRIDYNESTAKTNSYYLSQIYIDNKKKTAIINGKTVRIGSLIDNAEVMNITSNNVYLLINNSHKKTLKIAPSIKKYRH